MVAQTSAVEWLSVPALGRDLDLVAAGFDVGGDGAHEVPDAGLARRHRVEQVLALSRLHLPLVGEHGVVEAVVGEHLEHVAGEAVDVEVDPEVHVMDVGLVRVDRMELARPSRDRRGSRRSC
jgi:hypothetical protein